MILTTRPIDAWPRPETRNRGHAGFLEAAADAGGLMTLAVAMIDDPVARAYAYRVAVKALHPDAGGDAADFQRLQEAKRVLDAADR